MISTSFSIASYSKIMMQLVRSPGLFFATWRETFRVWHAVIFLLISSCLFTAAALSVLPAENVWISGIMMFANAFGMVLILSVVGYAIMGLSIGRKAPFGIFFSVYAYASGATLLAAWIPSMMIVTEPWRWILIGIGLRRTCGLGTGATLWVIFGSITIVTLLLGSLL